MDATTMEGNRMNVSSLWVSGGKLWTVQKKLADGSTRVRCSKRVKQNCKARGTLNVDMAMINEVVLHSCDVSEVDIEALRLRSALKRSILVHNQHLATTYTNVAARFSDAAREKVPFEVMQSTLYKIRKAFPKEQHCCPICLLKMEALVS